MCMYTPWVPVLSAQVHTRVHVYVLEYISTWIYEESVDITCDFALTLALMHTGGPLLKSNRWTSMVVPRRFTKFNLFVIFLKKKKLLEQQSVKDFRFHDFPDAGKCPCATCDYNLDKITIVANLWRSNVLSLRIVVSTMPGLQLILVGPPAAGKGTQAALIAKKYGCVPVSTGDLMRNMRKGSPHATVSTVKLRYILSLNRTETQLTALLQYNTFCQ